jgi:hypothetical protein
MTFKCLELEIQPIRKIKNIFVKILRFPMNYYEVDC